MPQLRRWCADTLIAATALATVASNLPDRIIDFHRIHTRSPYSIPNWRFFGPSPGTIDVHLYIRHDIAGRWTNWTSVMPPNPRSPIPVLFNPGNRAQKVLIDLAMTLYDLHAAHPDDFDSVIRSDAYQRLTAIGVAVKSPSGATRGQLMLLESTPGALADQGTPAPIVVTNPFHAPTHDD